jgi:glutathione S-transferase
MTRLERRASFQQEPALWWEPGVSYANSDEIACAREKTIHSGLTFSERSGQGRA